MPSVTSLAFNYLTCWQLEVEKQGGEGSSWEGKRQAGGGSGSSRGGGSERAELSHALMKTHELQYFLNTSLKNIDLAQKSS